MTDVRDVGPATESPYTPDILFIRRRDGLCVECVRRHVDYHVYRDKNTVIATCSRCADHPSALIALYPVPPGTAPDDDPDRRPLWARW